MAHRLRGRRKGCGGGCGRKGRIDGEFHVRRLCRNSGILNWIHRRNVTLVRLSLPPRSVSSCMPKTRNPTRMVSTSDFCLLPFFGLSLPNSPAQFRLNIACSPEYRYGAGIQRFQCKHALFTCSPEWQAFKDAPLPELSIKTSELMCY